MATALGNGNKVLTTTPAAPTSTSTATTAAPPSTIATATPASETSFGVELFNLITENRNNNDKACDTAVPSAVPSTATAMNVIISPLLLESMLALLYLGSDGITAEQLKSILQLQQRFNGSNAKMANYYAAHLEITTTKQQATQIQLGHKVLLLQQHEQQQQHQQISEEFQKIAHKYFHTTTEKTSTTNEEKLKMQINETLESITMQPLKEIAINANTLASANGSGDDSCSTESTGIDRRGPKTAAIVLSAANLKSKWFLPFSAYRSGFYDFHNKSEEPSKSVVMLFDDDMFVKFGDFRELDAKAIELPYECDCDDNEDFIDDLAMLLILPNQRDGLSQLKEKLKSVNMTTLTEHMQMENVQVLLPKFDIDFECSLRQYFDELGLSSIHSDAANFKNLLADQSSNGSGLKIADIVHKVHIAVNESGSEVSKVEVTKPIVLSNSLGPKKKFFRAGHPFLFAVRRNEVTYFLGCVEQL